MSSNNTLMPMSDDLQRYDSELRALQQELSLAHSRELSLRQEISYALAQIARYQLKGDLQQSLEITRLLEQRKNEEAQVAERQAKAEAGVERHQQMLLEVSAEVQAQSAALDRQLAEDPEYQQQVHALHATEAAQAAAAESCRELRDECATKLRSFQVDRLYLYLKVRKFGTETYPRWTPWRGLDRWVAKLCNFTANWQAEQTLLAIQEASEAALRQAERELAAQQAKVSNLHSRFSAAFDFVKLQQALRAGAQALDAAKVQAKEVYAELEVFSLRRDQHLVRASQLLAEQLNDMSIQELERLAAQTVGPEDDALVLQVRGMRVELDELQVRVPLLERKCKKARKEYKQAKRIERLLEEEEEADEADESSAGEGRAAVLSLVKSAFTVANALAEATLGNSPNSGPSRSSSSWGDSGASRASSSSAFSDLLKGSDSRVSSSRTSSSSSGSWKSSGASTSSSGTGSEASSSSSGFSTSSSSTRSRDGGSFSTSDSL
ncbi:hypothetical protein [Pseudomonas sp. Fl4BN1]|uniref:hypothetical protein n=1 Tax=Pseudomonas sp. Fl4BN1 TaxID=2697651 RepID=UPI0013785398|nr:hypothetical protein [Pseudomonas sp. Fl4BN1]NBF08429.1 hypothetical protein [Pseudomonas sp. Fl4BN1]